MPVKTTSANIRSLYWPSMNDAIAERPNDASLLRRTTTTGGAAARAIIPSPTNSLRWPSRYLSCNCGVVVYLGRL